MARPGTFQAGDARINRAGRPKNFTALRKLAQQIALEPVLLKDGLPVTINGKQVTNIERILREWARSGNGKMQAQFVEVAYGKVPTEIILQQDLTMLPDEALEKVSKGRVP